MKYIGNKTRLLNFIENSLEEGKIEYRKKKVIDLFAGTGSVSNLFLKNNNVVISCDNMTYSIAEQYRTNFFTEEPTFEELKNIVEDISLEGILQYLNNLEGQEGYFFENYAPNGKAKRQYFNDNNAKKIDSIRETIESWKDLLPYSKYMFLIGILMCSADKVSNTSGTYGAYLKIWRSMALKDIKLEKPLFTSKGINSILKSDVIDCVKNNPNQDIIYLDPPYNERQYASNFHVLESIVVYDKQTLKGKTGLRNYDEQKSNYCMKAKVLNEFEKLINYCNSKYIIMSYSTEGLLSENEIIEVLSKKGTVEVYRNPYRRFKTNSWTKKETNLEELLFICKVFKNDKKNKK